ncbi:hypothetical protein B5P44_25595 [Mycobacterium sp. CBMA 213]|nr:hypothetical protein [Mycolicibacterium sp. CBMA 213]
MAAAVRAPVVTLTAQSASATTQADPTSLFVDWFQRIVIPPSASAPFPAPQSLPTVAPTSIGSSIKGIYNAVEPWVRYGFDLAAYAVGWVPYVGWLAPQITIFYNFGERIARSITYNIADWLDGRVTFAQGLTNVGVDTFNSFVQLGIDQWNFWLPPLPPLPPLPFSSTPSTTATTATISTSSPKSAVTSTTKTSAGFETVASLSTSSPAKRDSDSTAGTAAAPKGKIAEESADAALTESGPPATRPRTTPAAEPPAHKPIAQHVDRKSSGSAAPKGTKHGDK